MELKIKDLKYRDILVHKETGIEYEVIGFDSNGKEVIFSSGEVANDLKHFKKIEDEMELKTEELKVGDVIVNKENSKELTVKCIHVNDKKIYIEGRSGYLHSDNLIHFKKKEQSQQYTFDDLIDVAVQAYKDGVATIKIDTKLHTVFVEELKTTYGIGHIDLGIKNIQSLYKETFVIEAEDDLNKIRNGRLSITLANGEVLENDHIFFVAQRKNDFVFKLLKGATVTQSK